MQSIPIVWCEAHHQIVSTYSCFAVHEELYIPKPTRLKTETTALGPAHDRTQNKNGQVYLLRKGGLQFRVLLFLACHHRCSSVPLCVVHEGGGVD